MKNSTIEILAPAGSMESLIAAVRCGANAVYLGTAQLNARASAKNFDKTLLTQAVSYCHARGVKVHLTLNTIVFQKELSLAVETIKIGAEAGVDAFIIADLAVLELAKHCAPNIERHASTQMAVHNIEGVKVLEQLGFHRVVLARELSTTEISAICGATALKVECFVHGALCMCISGQCYLSSMIGQRSGNRGRCAQPCRLPFQSGGSDHALSLKDLSAIYLIPKLAELGVSSFKIEGRLKHPQYVAATVTACGQAVKGEPIDYEGLQAVFSRSGFTNDYLDGNLGDHMFGVRTKEDLQSTSSVLSRLQQLYKDETPLVPVHFNFTMKAKRPSLLTVSSGTTTITVEGEAPEVARTAPTTKEKLEQAFSKTGGTPFYPDSFSFTLDDGLIMPVSQLNLLRRTALDQLLSELERNVPSNYFPYTFGGNPQLVYYNPPQTRGRFSLLSQFTPKLAEFFDAIILPISEALNYKGNREKILLEIPDFVFGKSTMAQLKTSLQSAKDKGFRHLMAGSLAGIYLGRELGFTLHGDYRLNIVNSLSLGVYKELGLSSATLSLECPADTVPPLIPTGIIAFGNPPLMAFRGHPAGMNNTSGTLTDRLGNSFMVEKLHEVSQLYNTVPLNISGKKEGLTNLSFHTLYFTWETLEETTQITTDFFANVPTLTPHTKGLYHKTIL